MKKRKFNWDCEKQGCFNTKKRADLTVFDDCFEGNMGMGDVDGLIEICHRYLMFEFKAYGVPTPVGQDIMFKRLAIDKNFTVVVVEYTGDICEMNVVTSQTYWNGKKHPKRETDLNELKEQAAEWARWATKKTEDTVQENTQSSSRKAMHS